LLLAQLMAAFSGEARRVKALRGRRLAGDPEEHWENLRQCEWMMRVFRARNAERLLAGQAIDLENRRAPWAPDDWTPPRPKTSDELCLRFAFIARFWADPEAHIRRHAQRLARARARRVYAIDPENPTWTIPSWMNPSWTILAATRPTLEVLSAPGSSGERIRAPPGSGPGRGPG
jgi:hypothetical protein